MNYKYLSIESAGAIAVITLNRPECGNALSIILMQEIVEACQSFKYDSETRAIIFKGEGKHFCTGADLKDPDRIKLAEQSLLEKSRATQYGRDLIEAILGLNQITVAAVQGAAAGGGACIATACDFRVGSEDCLIGYPEVKLGMNLSWGALPLCYNLVGPARAKRLVIGGELESAQDLLQWGFLDQVVVAEELHVRAREVAELYAARPPLAAQMIKRGLNALQMNSSAVVHMDGDQFALSTESEDYLRARQAFWDRKNK